MPQSTCQEDSVCRVCEVFLALMTVQAAESIHISKWCPGCKTSPLITAKVLLSALLCLFPSQICSLLPQTGSDTKHLADPESVKFKQFKNPGPGQKRTVESQFAHIQEESC